jgi:hypothetical protein
MEIAEQHCKTETLFFHSDASDRFSLFSWLA